MSFTLTTTPINASKISEDIIQDNTGALVTFRGIVRNINNGKKVLKITYEAYDQLVLSEAKKINHSALETYDIQHIKTFHRTGELQVGDTAIWVGVTAMHRKDAFLACESLMNQYKHTLPIWKKETYVDGVSEWVMCHCH